MQHADYRSHSSNPPPPFDPSGVLGALQREVDWTFKVGADGVATGMVSELLRITDAERLQLTERIVEFTAGRGIVFAGVGSESKRQSRDSRSLPNGLGVMR